MRLAAKTRQLLGVTTVILISARCNLVIKSVFRIATIVTRIIWNMTMMPRQKTIVSLQAIWGWRSLDSISAVQGTVKNNSSSTVSYVKVKCAFMDNSGNVIDTNWTYAVGSEGLAPGESKKWEMMVSYDRKIDKCRATILDFNS